MPFIPFNVTLLYGRVKPANPLVFIEKRRLHLSERSMRFHPEHRGNCFDKRHGGDDGPAGAGRVSAETTGKPDGRRNARGSLEGGRADAMEEKAGIT
jgi:hypothetical protein